jgi:hypothetical protein
VALFGDQPEQDVRRAVSLVEQTIAALGHDPTVCRSVVPDGSSVYTIARGSAQLMIAVRPGASPGGEGSIRVCARVVRLPAPARQSEFFERLLVLNSSALCGVAFALDGGDAVLITERSVRDLDASEVDTMVRVVGREADKYDDELATDFDTIRSSDEGNTAADADR